MKTITAKNHLARSLPTRWERKAILDTAITSVMMLPLQQIRFRIFVFIRIYSGITGSENSKLRSEETIVYSRMQTPPEKNLPVCSAGWPLLNINVRQNLQFI